MNKRCHIHFLNPVDAIIPTYDEWGNNVCKLICTKGAETLTTTNVKKFLQEWFQFLRIDLYAQRMWTQEVLGKQNLNPILINEHAVFIPVKFRKSVGAKDGCYGYVRLNSIKSICPDKIHLHNGTNIPYLSSQETIRGKSRDAKLLAYLYIEERKLHDMIYRKEKVTYTSGEAIYKS